MESTIPELKREEEQKFAQQSATRRRKNDAIKKEPISGTSVK